MSTLSSSINSIAAAIVIDVQARFRPQSTDRERLTLARQLTLVVGAVGTGGALLLASADVAGLWDTFLSALGLFGGGLAGVFALGIFTTRASSRGALAGLVASAAVLFLVQRYTSVHFFLYAGIGIVTCMGVGYLVSFVWPRDGRSLEGLTVHTRTRPVAAVPAPAGAMEPS
jgi:Na+/proline symporter